MCTKIYIYRDILEVMQCLIKVMPVICNVNENKNRNHMRNYNHHHSKKIVEKLFFQKVWSVFCYKN